MTPLICSVTPRAHTAKTDEKAVAGGQVYRVLGEEGSLGNWKGVGVGQG